MKQEILKELIYDPAFKLTKIFPDIQYEDSEKALKVVLNLYDGEDFANLQFKDDQLHFSDPRNIPGNLSILSLGDLVFVGKKLFSKNFFLIVAAIIILICKINKLKWSNISQYTDFVISLYKLPKKKGSVDEWYESYIHLDYKKNTKIDLDDFPNIIEELEKIHLIKYNNDNKWELIHEFEDGSFLTKSLKKFLHNKGEK